MAETVAAPALSGFPDARHPAPSTSLSASTTRDPMSPPGPSYRPNGHSHVHAQAHAHVTGGNGAKAGDSLPNIGEMDAKCGGCEGVIEQDSGGVVVAFGSSLWHVDCFKCAKCKEKVSADTNLLLLSDGSPVCGNCSYQCFVCKQAITEEAIMTGDESYHAHCFTCRTCKRRIEELVFAKTSQGIYCMASLSCHNERVAKSRRHAEAKRQRAARKEREREGKDREDDRRAGRLEDGRSASSSSLGPTPQPSSMPPPPPPPPPVASVSTAPSSSSPTGSPYATPSTQDAAKFSDNPSPLMNGLTSSSEDDHSVAGGATGSGGLRSRELSVDKLIGRSPSPNGHRLAAEPPLPPLPQSPSDRSFGPGKARPILDGRSPSPGPPVQNGGPITSAAAFASTSNLSPSSSARPMAVGLGVGPVGLNVPTTKAERRRSINPAMAFNLDASNNTFAVEPRLSPLPPSPLRASFTEQQKTFTANGAQPLRSPGSPSPQTFGSEGFPFRVPPQGVQRTGTPDSSAGSPTTAHAPPPRKSSLTEANLAIVQPRTRSHSAAAASPSVREEEVLDIPPRSSSSIVSSQGTAAVQAMPASQAQGQAVPLAAASSSSSTPKLFAPDLPTMSFSLSDPDFAVILKGMDGLPKSPEKTKATSTHANAEPQPVPEVDLDDSPPTSPGTDAAPPFRSTRSPPGTFGASPGKIRQESDGGEVGGSSSGGVSQLRDYSPGRARLTPNSSQAPLLRTRQPSAESTHSLSGRLGPDSALSDIARLVAEAKHTGNDRVEVDVSVLSGVMVEMEDVREVLAGLRKKYTGVKRTSQQYSEGLTVAGEEYDKEVAIRREMEAEITRLKAQVHSQTARLSVISGDERRQDALRRRSHDLAHSLTGLERDISRLRAQRDMTLAEVEELQKSNRSGATTPEAGDVSQSLTNRLDTIREQYREELEPLTAQREALQREIADLLQSKEQFLEESTALAAKNEELAELNAQLSRQADMMQDALARQRGPTIFSSKRGHPSNSPSLSSLATSATLQEVPEETARVVKVTKPDPQPIEAAPARRFKWYNGYKSSKGPSPNVNGNSGSDGTSAVSISRPIALGLPNGSGGSIAFPAGADPRKLARPSTEFATKEHVFQQFSSMRFAKCELCGEKMWGLQEVRCNLCGTVCHAKCAEKLPRSCTGSKSGVIEHLDGLSPPTMFGRELAEQAAADKADVPVIVTKSIAAVEAVGMEYEGIYRKTGGSSQSKQIQQLFERGDYDAFDLTDVEAFNDISSVTSTLKTYFRSLPNPLLTHGLHESFVAAATIKDMSNRQTALAALLKELPREHYNTLRELMLHLHRVTAASGTNLMTSQNLGVVFGPTLMRSSDPNREFGDMGGKAMCIQWMVENALGVFAEVRSA